MARLEVQPPAPLPAARWLQLWPKVFPCLWTTDQSREEEEGQFIPSQGGLVG